MLLADIIDLGAGIGEIVGAIGIIITLVYLAQQMRQNTRATEAASFQTSVGAFSSILADMASNPELSHLYFEGGRDFETLSREDRRRYAMLMSGILHRYENFLYQTEMDLVPRESWAGFAEELRIMFKKPGMRAWWKTAHVTFNQQLQDFVQRECLAPLENSEAA